MKALDRLGIRDCFEKIICFETMNPNLWKPAIPDVEYPVVLKPSMEAMRIAIDDAHVDPRRTVRRRSMRSPWIWFFFFMIIRWFLVFCWIAVVFRRQREEYCRRKVCWSSYSFGKFGSKRCTVVYALSGLYYATYINSNILFHLTNYDLPHN